MKSILFVFVLLGVISCAYGATVGLSNETDTSMNNTATEPPTNTTARDPPVVFKTEIVKKSPTSALINRAITKVSTTFLVTGANFGGPTDPVTVKIGPFPCVGVTRPATNQLECTVYGGSGSNLVTVVSVGGLSSGATTTATSGAAATARIDFGDPTTPGLTCVPPFGSSDIFAPERCNCWSGSASTDVLLNTDCDMHAKCAGLISSPTTVASHPPTRPTTTFKNDHIEITQLVPIVKNRRDTVIRFAAPGLSARTPAVPVGTVGAATCFYPGNLWEKKLNDLDCVEEYHGVIPWSQHEMCGFVEDLDPSNMANHLQMYRTSMLTSFTETYKNAKNELVMRTIVHTFAVSVSFLKQIKQITTSITVYIADQNDLPSLTVEVLGDALYDVASKLTLIDFQTTIVWPYKIVTITEASYTKDVSNTETASLTTTVTPSTTNAGFDVCDNTQDSDCSQSWLLEIDTTACNIMGDIIFNTNNLNCRDLTTGAVSPCPGNPSTTFTIKIGKTDLCDDNSKTLDASQGLAVTLDTFFDEEYQQPQAVFQTGDMIYFAVAVKDPLSTLDRVVFNQIVVSKPDLTASTTLFQLDPPVSLSAADFNITNELITSLSPNAVGVLSFQFRLNRNVVAALNLLASNGASDLTKDLTVAVTIDLYYHGNSNTKKRVLASSALPISSVAHAHFSFYDMEKNEVEDEILNGSENDADAADMWKSGVAQVVVAPVVVILAVICAFA